MTIPLRQEPCLMTVQSATSHAGIYQVTLQDGTVLWVPENADNRDCAALEEWAESNAITL